MWDYNSRDKMNVKQNMAQSHCHGYRSPTCWFPWPSLKLCCRGWSAEKSIIFSIWAPRTGGGSLLVFLEISYGMETRTRPPSVNCSVFSSSEERDICTPPRSFFRLQNYFGMQTHCTVKKEEFTSRHTYVSNGKITILRSKWNVRGFAKVLPG